jgi:hypothetical protein
MSCIKLILVMVMLSGITLQACSQGDYVTTDPAILEMEMSLDMPRQPAPAGHFTMIPNTNMPAAANLPLLNVAGNWHLMLMTGVSIDLILSQSGNVVFGRGNVALGNNAQWATSSGFVSGNTLRLDVVPADGLGLYAIALDLSGQRLAGTYTVFSSGAATSSGTITGSRSAA